MSENYDSILKEKKKYTLYEDKHPIFKKFMLLAFLVVILIIVVGYIIYYNTVLSGEVLILNNFTKITDRYLIMADGLELDYDFSSNYKLEGNISVNNYKYDYSYIKDNNKVKKVFSKDNKKISFYYDNDLYYMNLSSLGNNYIEVDNKLFSIDLYNDEFKSIEKGIYNYLNDVFINESVMKRYNRVYSMDNFNQVYDNILNNFSNYVSDDKFDKKLYFYNGRPVVKIDLVLKTKDINKILGNGENNLEVKDDIEMSITSRNDAIMNDIKDMKVIIINKTKDTRSVINYDGTDIIYTDNDGVNNKYSISGSVNNFTLKIYKDDVLFSALEGKKNNNDYNYTYQVIDKLERISLDVNKNKDTFSYKLSSNVDKQIDTVIVGGTYYYDGAIDEDVTNVYKYRELDDRSINVINSSIKNILLN